MRLLALCATCCLAGTANAATFTDRALFEAAIDIAFTEDFESCGTQTVTFTGPLAGNPVCSGIVSGFDASSASNQLFIAGPGQSGNPTTALGLNFPSGAALFLTFGGVYDSFGLDLFQNIGGGTSGAQPIPYELDFRLQDTQVELLNTNVAPAGSFFGRTGLSFDEVRVTSLQGFAVIDNVTVGLERRDPPPAPIPLPGGLPLLLGGLALLA